MKNLAFTGWKARRVMELPIGGIGVTRRMINPPDWWEGHCHYAKGEAILCAPDGGLQQRCRYRPGDVCYVGVPNLRDRRDKALVIPCVRPLVAITMHGERFPISEAAEAAIDGSHFWHRMAGRFLPAWGATAWARILSNGPSHLQDCTEKDAMLELVEWNLHDSATDWRDYGTGLFTCYSAIDSFRTAIEAIYGEGTWERDPWAWRIEFQRVEKPEDAP